MEFPRTMEPPDNKDIPIFLNRMFEKAHKCTECCKRFSTPHLLSQHTLVHTNIRKFHCQYCDKAFKQLSHVQQHERTHTGERPWKCTVGNCAQTFVQLSGLKQHIKTHNLSEDQQEKRPFRCQVCARRFATEGSVSHHMTKMHQAMMSAEDAAHQVLYHLMCQACNTQCSDQQRLYTHIQKMHPGYWEVYLKGQPPILPIVVKKPEVKEREKPHVCSICHRRYSHETAYRKHMGSHPQSDAALRMQLWSCLVCEKHFTKESFLLRHLQMKGDVRHSEEFERLRSILRAGTEELPKLRQAQLAAAAGSPLTTNTSNHGNMVDQPQSSLGNVPTGCLPQDLLYASPQSSTGSPHHSVGIHPVNNPSVKPQEVTSQRQILEPVKIEPFVYDSNMSNDQCKLDKEAAKETLGKNLASSAPSQPQFESGKLLTEMSRMPPNMCASNYFPVGDPLLAAIRTHPGFFGPGQFDIGNSVHHPTDSNALQTNMVQQKI